MGTEWARAEFYTMGSGEPFIVELQSQPVKLAGGRGRHGRSTKFFLDHRWKKQPGINLKIIPVHSSPVRTHLGIPKSGGTVKTVSTSQAVKTVPVNFVLGSNAPTRISSHREQGSDAGILVMN